MSPDRWGGRGDEERADLPPPRTERARSIVLARGGVWEGLEVSLPLPEALLNFGLLVADTLFLRGEPNHIGDSEGVMGIVMSEWITWVSGETRGQGNVGGRE